MNEITLALAERYGARDWQDKNSGLSSVYLDSKKVHDTLLWLQNLGGYRHLSFATAVDNIESDIFTLVYAVRNHERGHSLLVHCELDRNTPVMDSIHLLWGQAWTYQREMKEWFGIDFPGSPRVDEEFVLEGWDGPPMMRRDFDSLAYSEATYADRPGRETKDPTEYMKEKLYPEASR